MAKFLVLYRGGDGSKLTPKQNDTLMQKWGQYMETGISDLLALDGTSIHPRSAERTKFCSAHNRPAPKAVTPGPP